jgi:DNA-binding response OmpR family regulator
MKSKILIVDDDPGIQDIFKIIFEKAGYEVMIESDGKSIGENKYDFPDIYLLDRHLSGTDGIDICIYLKSLPQTKNIPVIMVSASPDIASLAAAAGADDFLEKPFTIPDLLAIVQKQLKRSSLKTRIPAIVSTK